MKKYALIFAALILGSALGQAQKLRCLVTHDEPTEKEREFLSLDAGDLLVKANERGYVVFESNIATFIRPKTLYNLHYMQQCMDGFATLAIMAGKGQFKGKFSELTPNQRAGVRAIMADSFLMAEAGPVIAKDDTEFAIVQRRSITLSNGRRDVSITLPSKSADTNIHVQDGPTADELERFKGEEGAPFRKQKFRDSLVFTFAPNDVATVGRPLAIEEYMKEIQSVLHQQREAFVAARAALLASFGQTDAKEGESWNTLDDETKRFIESRAKESFAALGFSSRDEADLFIAHARVKGMSNQVFVGIDVKEGGMRNRKLASIDVIRN
jgi:hypothetical protein